MVESLDPVVLRIGSVVCEVGYDVLDTLEGVEIEMDPDQILEKKNY